MSLYGHIHTALACNVTIYVIALEEQRQIVIYNSYFISGFGARNNMIDPYVILAMLFNFILSSNSSFVLSKFPVFIMAMPPNMIFVMYVIPCILSHDF